MSTAFLAVVQNNYSGQSSTPNKIADEVAMETELLTEIEALKQKVAELLEREEKKPDPVPEWYQHA